MVVMQEEKDEATMKKINYVKLTLDLLMAVTFVLLFNTRIPYGSLHHRGKTV